MNRQLSHSVQVVKREEKETKLTEFVLGEIASGRVTLEGQWSVLALSMDSPVLAVLRRVLKDLGGAAGLQVQVVLTACVKHEIGDGIEGAGAFSIRESLNSRLLDAHEQLVLGTVSSWTGDCMRRNPRERDAFETFAGGNALLSEWGKRSFDGFWGTALPVAGGSRSMDGFAGEARLDDVLAGEGRQSVTVSASSRH